MLTFYELTDPSQTLQISMLQPLCEQLRQKSWSPRSVSVWQHVNCQTSGLVPIHKIAKLLTTDVKQPYNPPQKKKQKQKNKQKKTNKQRKTNKEKQNKTKQNKTKQASKHVQK